MFRDNNMEDKVSRRPWSVFSEWQWRCYSTMYYYVERADHAIDSCVASATIAPFSLLPRPRLTLTFGTYCPKHCLAYLCSTIERSAEAFARRSALG